MEAPRNKSPHSSSGVFQSEPYSYRPPSPPMIPVAEHVTAAWTTLVPPRTTFTPTSFQAKVNYAAQLSSSTSSKPTYDFSHSRRRDQPTQPSGRRCGKYQDSSDEASNSWATISRSPSSTPSQENNLFSSIPADARLVPDQPNMLETQRGVFILPPQSAQNRWQYMRRMRPQLVLKDAISNWQYDHRREAQRVLEHVFLGPMSAARDADFLRRERITLLLAVREQRLAAAKTLGAGAERAAKAIRDEYEYERGGERSRRCPPPLVVRYVDVIGAGPRFGDSTASAGADAGVAPTTLVSALPDAVRAINEHLDELSRVPFWSGSDDADGDDDEDDNDAPAASARRCSRGRILVFCESGNGLSAVLVAAYLMDTWGLSLARAVQWVASHRFCALFAEPEKRMLQSFEELMVARRHVEAAAAAATETGGAHGHSHVLASSKETPQVHDVSPAAMTTAGKGKASAVPGGGGMRKRRIEETRDDDEMADAAMAMNLDDGEPDYTELAMDRERFVGRDRHVPFVDVNGPN